MSGKFDASRTIVLAAVLCLQLPYAASVGAAPFQRSEKESEIAQLIQQLEHRKYKSRESATAQLIEVGEIALPKLARLYTDAPPETAWRTLRILRKLATESNQELTSLKSIALLLVLDSPIDNELSAMLELWRENRSQRVIEFLVQKGASIVSTQVNQAAGAWRALDGIQDDVNPLRSRSVRKTIQTQQLATYIEEILDGDLESVQKFVFSKIPQPNQRRDQFNAFNRVNGRFFADGFSAPHGSNTLVYLEIGPGWKGDFNDLQKLKDIHSLYGLRLKNQEIAADVVGLISELTNLQVVGLEGNQFSEQSISQIELPPNVAVVELKDVRVNDEVVNWIGNHPVISLAIENCDLTADGIPLLAELQSLQSLAMTRTKLSTEFFDAVFDLRVLGQISVSACKFKIEDFRRFERARPKVIQPRPVSFLGVRGSNNGVRPFEVTCLIDEVIEGSGAAEAGVKVSDLIIGVNGDEIKDFNELRVHISQHDVGEEMVLRVLRDGQELELTATLGRNLQQALR